MRIYGFERYGGPEVEGFLDVAAPQVSDGAVLVRTTAAGVNPADVKVRAGQRTGTVEVRFPMAMGREAAGVVMEDPSGTFAAGEAVFGSSASGVGALAETTLLDVGQTARIPDGVDPVAAACLPVAVGTAWDMLHEVRVGAGETVLVLGAGGGVGIHTAQLARHLGATVLGVARAPKAALLETHGVTHIPATDGWVEEVGRLAPRGVDAVVDTVGGTLLTAAAGLLADRGRLRSVAEPARATDLGGSGVTRRRDAAVYAELAALVADGTLTPVVDRVHPFASADLATAHVASGHSSGKTVVTF